MRNYKVVTDQQFYCHKKRVSSCTLVEDTAKT